MSGSDSPTFFHGQPWSSWIEKIGRDKPLSDEEPDNEPASSVMRLSVEDIDLYGFCPERDTFYGVVCEICNSIVKPQALIQHMECRHPSGTSGLPPPSNSTTKPAMKTPYCKLSKLKKSHSPGQLSVNNSNNGNNNTNSSNNSKASNNHTPIKQRTVEQQPNLHSTISVSSPRSPVESSTPLPCVQSTGTFANAVNASGSPVKSPGNQPKRKKLKTERSLLKDREYDPDRHCGVWNEETGKPCTRSLTCKAHTVSLRRTVTGRSKTFDKLLAEHRAAKELPNTRTPSSKVTSTGAVTSGSSSNTTSITGSISITAVESGMLNPNTPTGTVSMSSVELEQPSSPPVLSLPDTYPLPQAVDLLYRCLAPHGSNKPTKLEEDFANELESTRRIESSVVNNNNSNTSIVGTSSNANNNNSAIAPISVVLPSLSPIPTSSMSPQASLLQYNRNNNSSPMNMEQIINKQSPSSAPLVPTVFPVSNQPAPCGTTVLEAKTAPIDIDNSQNITMYTSPVYKDSGKSQVTVQISRSNMLSQSSVSRSYSNLFDSTLDHLPTDNMQSISHTITNGKCMSNHHHMNLQNQLGRTKHEFSQEYATAIQLEATTASTPYTDFNDISWSNCHPEPLAVSRWLRINSSRKQYNFNIH